MDNGFRTYLSDGMNLLLFQITATNRSLISLSLSPKLSVEYLNEHGEKKSANLNHQPHFFSKLKDFSHERIESNLRLDGLAIQTGFLVFEYPKFLGEMKINSYNVIITDGHSNSSSCSILIIKDLVYEN